MLKVSARSGIIVAVAIAVLIIDVVLGGILGVVLGANAFTHPGASQGTKAPPTKTAPLLTTVTIPPAQDLFKPFILTVLPNTTVTWQNNDTVAHTFKTTPDQSNFLNLQAFSLNVAAGAASSSNW